MTEYRCKIHGDLHGANAWVDSNNKVICSLCGIYGESVVVNGSTDLSNPAKALIKGLP